MSTVSGTWRGPNIVKDSSLVLYLDASAKNSYNDLVNAGAWKDMSGNNNSGSLINGITFSTNNTGNLFFNSSSLQYVDFYVPNLGTTTTVEIWCNIQNLTNTMVFGWYSYDVWTGATNNGLGYNTGAGDIYGISNTVTAALGCLNNWKQYVFEMRSDITYTNNKIYINAISQTLSQIQGTESAANRNFNSGFGRIGVWRYDTLYCITMNCASFKIYNRALTAAEITQNFNATRGRFGI
jgi:hypothetical protein